MDPMSGYSKNAERRIEILGKVGFEKRTKGTSPPSQKNKLKDGIQTLKKKKLNFAINFVEP